jgi:pimeloyl-ACP methyl ester carboxylesterase
VDSRLYIEIDNLKINYEVEGEGNPVILLHGWLANLKTMKPLANGLKDKFKVYNVDVVGFGESDLPKEPYNTDEFGNFLNKFVKALKIEKPILIGHSNGGKTIINAVGRGLVDAKKIVLIDSTGIKPKRKIKQYAKIYTFKICKNVLRIFPNNERYNQLRERVIGKFASADYKNSPEVLRRTMSNILNEDQRHLLPNIKIPTLLIWGEKDDATPISDAKIMEKLIPDAGLVEYKNSGHFSYLENLNHCIIVLREFLKNDS